MYKNRYSRNIACIGAEGQKRLSAASVFIIGCGALGGQVAMLLAGAGIGRIGIADYDTIDVTNLQRQLFFSEESAGKAKVEVIADSMKALNGDIIVEPYKRLIKASDSKEILANYDFIVDATDNPATKYMTDRLCKEICKPGCIAGVAGWKGQVMCISGDAEDGTSRFSDLFPAPEEDVSMLPCEVLGVMGATASTVASIQASEVLKYFLKEGKNLVNSLLTIDLLNMEFHRFEI